MGAAAKPSLLIRSSRRAGGGGSNPWSRGFWRTPWAAAGRRRCCTSLLYSREWSPLCRDLAFRPAGAWKPPPVSPRCRPPRYLWTGAWRTRYCMLLRTSFGRCRWC